MLDNARTFVGCLLIKAGMAMVPADVREFVRGIIMYHVPGAMSETEKAEIRAAKSAAGF
jgi:hypothetical protein